MERDIAGKQLINALYDFNSHAHVERDPLLFSAVSAGWYFNSHAHVERDDAIPDIINALPISTHTLTWSVTTLLYLAIF